MLPQWLSLPDADGDPLSFSIEDGPEWLSVTSKGVLTEHHVPVILASSPLYYVLKTRGGHRPLMFPLQEFLQIQQSMYPLMERRKSWIIRAALRIDYVCGVDCATR